MKNNQLLIFLVSFFFVAVSAGHYESILNFGDSLSDTGNLIKEIPNISSGQLNPGKLPNGQTFFKQATGRSSDGRLIIDFIADANGLPYLPPYRSLIEDKSLNITKIRQGMNFAVAGCTALDVEFLKEKNAKGMETNSSLNVQIEWFKKIKPSLCSTQQGFEKDFQRACCGGGGKYNQNMRVKCGDTDMTLCPDPSKFISWDGIHLTEAAYRNIASSLLDTFTNPPGFLNTSSYV